MPPIAAKAAKLRKRRPVLPHRHPRRTREEHSQEIAQDYVEIIAELIAAHSCPVSLHEGILYVHVLQPALHYELERVNKPEILRKLKQRFGSRTIREIKFRVG